MRNAGLLLHPTSLPGSGPSATLDDIEPLIDFLIRAGLSIWQLLPLNPVSADGSPYNSHCSFAANEALLPPQSRAQAQQIDHNRLEPFRQQNHYWLRDYALFTLLHQQQQCPWYEWPAPLRDRDPGALEQLQQTHRDELEQIEWRQWLFEQRWQQLHQRCREHGITLIGDLPFLCAHDSVDVWAHRELFQLDAAGQPTQVAGVPPDYFSELGQRWGNPVYAWPAHQMEGFQWWIERFRSVLQRVDGVRFDHFRGLSAYWSIPADAEDARSGEWKTSPGDALLTTLHNTLGGPLPIIAEDLGLITAEVHELRERHQLPGMAVLQFALDGNADNPHLPRNHTPHTIAYSGTHDNDTLVGWYDTLEAPLKQQARLQFTLKSSPPPLHWQLIERLLESPAESVILPLQDLLGLDSNHRMNTPGTTEGNWQWRAQPGVLNEQLAETLQALLQHHHRTP